MSIMLVLIIFAVLNVVFLAWHLWRPSQIAGIVALACAIIVLIIIIFTGPKVKLVSTYRPPDMATRMASGTG